MGGMSGELLETYGVNTVASWCVVVHSFWCDLLTVVFTEIRLQFTTRHRRPCDVITLHVDIHIKMHEYKKQVGLISRLYQLNRNPSLW